MLRLACVVLGAIGCGSVTASSKSDAMTGSDAMDGSDATPADAGSSDGPVDTAVTCDPMAPFGAPIAVAGVATDAISEIAPRLSPDERTMYFWGGPAGASHLYVTHRAKPTDPFDAPVPVPNVNSSAADNDPSNSADGNALWFASNRITGEGYHLYVATRPSSVVEFGAASLADGINSADKTLSDVQPFVTADGSELWFTSTRPPSQSADIWHATWDGTRFANPVQDIALSSAVADHVPTLSADRLTIYFSSNRTDAGAKGGFDVWRAHRSVVQDGFPAPSLVDELSAAGDDIASWLSADNCRIYGSRRGAVNADVFMATRQP